MKNINQEINFLNYVYKVRKEKIRENIQILKRANYLEGIVDYALKFINDIGENEIFYFFPKNFKSYINEKLTIDEIWKWCLFNAGLQYQFIENGFRFRETDSQVINKNLMVDPTIIFNSEKFIKLIEELDIAKKEERIKTIKNLFKNPTIKSSVFTEDPLFKKGFLAGMFFKYLGGDVAFDIQGGPCVDYHLMTFFKNTFDYLSDDKFILRMEIWYIIDRLQEESSYNFNEIDNRLFAFARKSNKNKIFIHEDTTWY